jgi:hypothetical protein
MLDNLVLVKSLQGIDAAKEEKRNKSGLDVCV